MSKSKGRKRLKTILQLLLFVAIIGGGMAFAKYFIDTKPTASRSRPARQAPLVDYIPVRSASKTVRVSAMGTVIPSKEIALYSQLSGTVDWISDRFAPGGKILEGERLVQLDRKDYELEVKKQEALIQQLQADLDLEKGKQEVAKKEIELMRRTTGKKIKDPKLALRVPQMEKVTAILKTQQIGLEQAKLNLDRTLIKAPFNAIVLDRAVELGSRITTQNALAKLIGTDSFWIEATIPVEKLKWINIPGINGEESSLVQVHLQDGSKAEGRVIRLLGDISTKSQMARLLVTVNDPLAMSERIGQMPLLLNSYVSLDLVGTKIDNVVEIPRKAVKDGNLIWMLEGDQLAIRRINPVWEDEENFYVRQNVKTGELLITSKMSAAVDGMEVRTNITKLAKKEKPQGKNNPKRKQQGESEQKTRNK